jgi:hypothetical protein
MIKHYFKIAVRNLSRQKALAFINVFGFSVGLACFILFLLFAVNEFSFDRFHKNKEIFTAPISTSMLSMAWMRRKVVTCPYHLAPP